MACLHFCSSSRTANKCSLLLSSAVFPSLCTLKHSFEELSSGLKPEKDACYGEKCLC